jgi:methylisocitrate lyase
MSQRAAKLRIRLAARGLLAAPGAYDALSARIVERSGFEAVYLGGNALGLGLGKGQPFVTLTETAEVATRIARTVEIPLIVDAGAGFGGPAHVHLAVRELEAAGAAALHIDDQPYPKEPGYHRGEGRLAPAEDVATRLRVAAAARRSAETLVIARTDALRVARSLDETIARARAYAAAGADALMVLDLGCEQASTIKATVPHLPLVWIGGVAAPVPTLDELGAAGFSLALYPFSAVAAVSAALADLWRELKSDGVIRQSPELLARARRETLEIVRMQEAFDVEAAVGGKV